MLLPDADAAVPCDLAHRPRPAVNVLLQGAHPFHFLGFSCNIPTLHALRVMKGIDKHPNLSRACCTMSLMKMSDVNQKLRFLAVETLYIRAESASMPSLMTVLTHGLRAGLLVL